MEIFVKKILLFPYFLFFLAFKHDFIRFVDFTRIATSNGTLKMREWKIQE